MAENPDGSAANHYKNDIRMDEDFGDAAMIAALATAFRVSPEDVSIVRGHEPEALVPTGHAVHAVVHRLAKHEPVPVVMSVTAMIGGDRSEQEIVTAIAAGLGSEVFVNLHEPAGGVTEYMIYPGGQRMWVGHFLDRMELAAEGSWPDYLNEEGPITMILPGTPIREDMDAIAAMQRENNDD